MVHGQKNIKLAQEYRNDVSPRDGLLLAPVDIPGTHLFVGRGSSVGTATRYGLDGPGFGSQWEGRFSAPVQSNPEAHPVFCTMGTGSI